MPTFERQGDHTQEFLILSPALFVARRWHFDGLDPDTGQYDGCGNEGLPFSTGHFDCH